REDGFVVIEQNAGVVHQCVETIALLRKFFRRALDAVDVGDVDLQERDTDPGAALGQSFLFCFAIEFFCCCLSGIGVARAEKYPETFARQLPDNFKSDSLVRAGTERHPFLSRHKGNLTTDHTDLNGSKGMLFRPICEYPWHPWFKSGRANSSIRVAQESV